MDLAKRTNGKAFLMHFCNIICKSLNHPKHGTFRILPFDLHSPQKDVEIKTNPSRVLFSVITRALLRYKRFSTKNPIGSSCLAHSLELTSSQVRDSLSESWMSGFSHASAGLAVVCQLRFASLQIVFTSIKECREVCWSRESKHIWITTGLFLSSYTEPITGSKYLPYWCL